LSYTIAKRENELNLLIPKINYSNTLVLLFSSVPVGLSVCLFLGEVNVEWNVLGKCHARKSAPPPKNVLAIPWTSLSQKVGIDSTNNDDAQARSSINRERGGLMFDASVQRAIFYDRLAPLRTCDQLHNATGCNLDATNHRARSADVAQLLPDSGAK